MNNKSLKANSSNNYIQDAKSFNPEQFVTDSNKQYANLHSSQPNTSTNELFEKFVSVLYDTYNQHVPLRKRSKKGNKTSIKTLDYKEIINLSKQKAKLYIVSYMELNKTKNNTNAFEIALPTKRNKQSVNTIL